MCKVGEYRRHTGEGLEQGRGFCLNNHVAQFSFYDIKLASNLTKPTEKRPEQSYNSLILRLYGLNWAVKKGAKISIGLVI